MFPFAFSWGWGVTMVDHLYVSFEPLLFVDNTAWSLQHIFLMWVTMLESGLYKFCFVLLICTYVDICVTWILLFFLKEKGKCIPTCFRPALLWSRDPLRQPVVAEEGREH